MHPLFPFFFFFLLFLYYSCNGTANIGWNVPNKTEFTVDVTVDDFEIPHEFSDGKKLNPYSPNLDRSIFKDQTDVYVDKPIYKGQELFDNYSSLVVMNILSKIH